jgi:hypothetical protein
VSRVVETGVHVTYQVDRTTEFIKRGDHSARLRQLNDDADTSDAHGVSLTASTEVAKIPGRGRRCREPAPASPIGPLRRSCSAGKARRALAAPTPARRVPKPGDGVRAWFLSGGGRAGWEYGEVSRMHADGASFYVR